LAKFRQLKKQAAGTEQLLENRFSVGIFKNGQLPLVGRLDLKVSKAFIPSQQYQNQRPSVDVS
jgi:hypothetical protein